MARPLNRLSLTSVTVQQLPGARACARTRLRADSSARRASTVVSRAAWSCSFCAAACDCACRSSSCCFWRSTRSLQRAHCQLRACRLGSLAVQKLTAMQLCLRGVQLPLDDLHEYSELQAAEGPAEAGSAGAAQPAAWLMNGRQAHLLAKPAAWREASSCCAAASALEALSAAFCAASRRCLALACCDTARPTSRCSDCSWSASCAPPAWSVHAVALGAVYTVPAGPQVLMQGAGPQSAGQRGIWSIGAAPSLGAADPLCASGSRLDQPLLGLHSCCSLPQAGLVLGKARASLCNGHVSPAHGNFFQLLEFGMAPGRTGSGSKRSTHVDPCIQVGQATVCLLADSNNGPATLACCTANTGRLAPPHETCRLVPLARKALPLLVLHPARRWDHQCARKRASTHRPRLQVMPGCSLGPACYRCKCALAACRQPATPELKSQRLQLSLHSRCGGRLLGRQLSGRSRLSAGPAPHMAVSEVQAQAAVLSPYRTGTARGSTAAHPCRQSHM